MRHAVFLDRDDTLNANADLPDDAFPHTRGDLFLPDRVELLPGVAEACAALKRLGFALVVVTNQAGAARGGCTLRDIDATNSRLRALVGDGPDGRPLIDACYSAPHHPDAAVAHLAEAHPWRKESPGMLRAAARELGLDLARSWIVGDKRRDARAGLHAGLDPARCVLVGPEPAPDPDDPTPVFASLAHAADHIARTVRARPWLSPTEPEPAHPDAKPAPPGPRTSVTLRATSGRPLTEPATRDTVAAAARAIAERTGIALLELSTTDRGVTAALATHRLAAIGFMAELRRITNRWYEARHPGDLLWPVGNVSTAEDLDEDDDDYRDLIDP